MTDIRWDLINHLRDQINNGTYITDGKLSITSRNLAALYGNRDLEHIETGGDQCRQRSISPHRSETTNKSERSPDS